MYTTARLSGQRVQGESALCGEVAVPYGAEDVPASMPLAGRHACACAPGGGMAASTAKSRSLDAQSGSAAVPG